MPFVDNITVLIARILPPWVQRAGTPPAKSRSGPKNEMHPAAWVGDALYLPQTRQKFRALCNLGLVDAVRAGSDDGGLYTFWDYQAGAWQKNDGIRIDHFLLSPQAADKLLNAAIDRHVRAWEKPSDHVPVVIELDIAAR